MPSYAVMHVDPCEPQVPCKPLLQVVGQVLHSCELCMRAHHAVLELSGLSSALLITGVCKAHVAEQVVRKLLHTAPAMSAGNRMEAYDRCSRLAPQVPKRHKSRGIKRCDHRSPGPIALGIWVVLHCTVK